MLPSPADFSIQGAQRRGNLRPVRELAGDCRVAALLAMTGTWPSPMLRANEQGQIAHGVADRHRHWRHLHRRCVGRGRHRSHRHREVADHAARFRPGGDRRHPPGIGRQPHRSGRRGVAVARDHRRDQCVAREQGRARRLRRHARVPRHPGIAAFLARRSLRPDAGCARGPGAAALAVRDHRTDRRAGRGGHATGRGRTAGADRGDPRRGIADRGCVFPVLVPERRA